MGIPVGEACARTSVGTARPLQGVGHFRWLSQPQVFIRRLLLLVLLIFLPQLSAQATTYTYDAAGRLKSATNSQGQTATYVYDSRGNLIRIARTDSTQLAIISFGPGWGAPGTQVTINGSGFAAITSDDAVAFNGIAAPVLSASPNQLLVQVPFNATSGNITVAVGAATATSADSFNVTTFGDPPSISGFSPAIAEVGDTVTVSGEHLAPITGETAILVDGVPVFPTAVGDLQISFAVPSWIGSGPITVSTLYGSATTTSVLTVVPMGFYSPTTITQNPPLVPGGAAQSVALSAAMPGAAFLFHASADQYFTLQTSGYSNTSASTTYQVYNPLGMLILSGSISAHSPSIVLPPLYAAGTYSVFFGGGASAPQFSVALSADPVVTPDGVPVTVAVAPWQLARFVFPAVAGGNYGVGLSSITMNSATGVSVKAVTPDGHVTGFNDYTQVCAVPVCAIPEFETPALVYTHYYQFTAGPAYDGGPLSYVATVSSAAQAQLPATNTPVTMNMPRQGQTGMYSFTGTAGQIVALRLSVPSNGNPINIQVVRPDGTSYITDQMDPSAKKTYNLTLPETGTYVIDVASVYATTSVLTATLAVDAPPVPVTDNGDTASVSNQLAGQNTYFTFNATAGQNLGLGISNIVSSDGGALSVAIYLPSGAQWSGQGGVCGPPQCAFSLSNMPATGAYTVVLTPASTFSAQITLSDRTDEPLTNDDTPVTLNLPRQGQNGTYSFSGTAGQNVALQLSVPSNGNPINIQLTKPDGSSYVTDQIDPSAQHTYNLALSQTGTYTIYVSAVYATTSIVSATLAVDAPSVPVTDNGDTASVSNQLVGQNTYFTFNATAGENLGLGISNIASSDGRGLSVAIYLPSGAQWSGQGGGCSPPNCAFYLSNMPATGMYTVVLTPSGTFSAQITLSDAATATLMPGSAPQTLNLSRFGQDGSYSFQGYAGEVVTLQFTLPTGNSLIGVQGFNPNGSYLFGGAWVYTTSTYNLTLSQTGTYTVQVFTNGGAPSTALATLAMVKPATLFFDPNNSAAAFAMQNDYQAAALSSSVSGGGNVSAYGNCGVSSGKWVYRMHVDSAAQALGIGIASMGTPTSAGFDQVPTGYALTTAGNVINNASAVLSSVSYGTGAVVDVAYDATNGNLWVAVNGSWIGGGNPGAVTGPLITGIPAGVYVPALEASQSGDGATIQAPPAIVGFTAWPGQCTSTNFVDVLGHTITASGSPIVTNVNSKFGSSSPGSTDPNFASVEFLSHFEQPTAMASSGLFNSSHPDFLSVPSSSDFDIGNGDFTWEAWVYPTSLSNYMGVLGKRATANDYGPYFLALNGGGMYFWMTNAPGGWTAISGGSGMTTNTWHHVMVSRVSGTVYMGFDGVIVAHASANYAAMTNAAAVSIGAMGVDGDNPFSGYIDEVRFTKGVGRYSGSSYAVPTAAFADH